MADPYQNTIDFAAKRYAAAVDGYRALEAELADLSANPADIGTGGPKENQYAALQKRLADASKAWSDAENDYQTALQAQDKARNDAKQYLPAGTTRTRLDTTAGNVLVSVTETADGQGGWSADPSSVKRVQVAGSQAAGTRITAPASDKYIVSMQDDGSLKQTENPNYQPDKSAAPSAVPNSEFIWNPQTGKVEQNPNYRPPNAEINITARQINDPNHPGQLIANPNYRPPAATINTTARQIEDPNHPGTLIANPNYQSPTDQLTPGALATDTAIASTAGDVAAANLRKAQADADRAALELQDAKRKAAQAPTDAQAQQAIATAQQAADLANQNLAQQIAQAKDANPIALQQAQATLERSRQVIDQAKQGDLYGRQDQIRQIRALVASGDVSPQEADGMVSALNSGTTVFDAQKQAQADRLTARGQTDSNLNSLAGNFTSAFNSGFSQIAQMNNYAPHGSTAGADAFMALLNMAQDRLKSYQLPDAQTSNYLAASAPASRVGAMADMAQQQTAAPPSQPSYGGMNIGSGAASNPQPPGREAMPFSGPTPTPQPMPAAPGMQPIADTMPSGGVGAHQVVINIGSGGGTAPPPAPAYNYTPETSAQSAQRNGLISSAAQSVPATEDDIYAAYGVQKPTAGGL